MFKKNDKIGIHMILKTRPPDVSKKSKKFEKLILKSSFPPKIEASLIENLISYDPNTKVSACIYDIDKKVILSSGYNKSIIKNTPWSKRIFGSTGDPWKDYEKTKYPYVVHAEVEAITKLLQNISIEGMKKKDLVLITNIFPCPNCSKLIVKVGIKKIVYIDNYKLGQFREASERILSEHNVVFSNKWQEVIKDF